MLDVACDSAVKNPDGAVESGYVVLRGRMLPPEARSRDTPATEPHQALGLGHPQSPHLG